MLPYESRPILLPHLGEWISSHSRPCWDEDRVDELNDSFWECTIRGAGDELFDESVVLQLGSYTIPATLYDGEAIYSTSGLYKGFRNMLVVEAQEAFSFDAFVLQTKDVYTLRQAELNKKFLDKFPILRDIDSSEPDTWWLFAIRQDWYLVDFERNRMWGSRCEPIMCYWEDVWEPLSWKLGSEGRKFGPSWFGLGDDGETEEDSVASEATQTRIYHV